MFVVVHKIVVLSGFMVRFVIINELDERSSFSFVSLVSFK